MYTPIKFIVCEKISHIVELVDKSKKNFKLHVNHSYNSNGYQNKRIYNSNGYTQKYNNNVRGYDFIKYESHNLPKPRGYVTKELKDSIEILCGSKVIRHFCCSILKHS